MNVLGRSHQESNPAFDAELGERCVTQLGVILSLIKEV